MTAPAIAPSIIEADLQNPEHQQAIVSLINHYAQEPIISGKPLPDHVQAELIAGLQQHPTTEIFLAFLDSQPVGIAVCFRGFSTFAAKALLNIHDLAVHANHRGQGVGRALLAAVEAKARATGCCRITLEVVENKRERPTHLRIGQLRLKPRQSSQRANVLHGKVTSSKQLASSVQRQKKCSPDELGRPGC